MSNEICPKNNHKIGFFYQLLSGQVCPENFREIGRFFRDFVPENPAKFDFFSVTYQKPWQVFTLPHSERVKRILSSTIIRRAIENARGRGGGYSLTRGYCGCAAGWGRIFTTRVTTSNSWHYSCPHSVYGILAPCVALWNILIHNEDVHTYSIQ